MGSFSTLCIFFLLSAVADCSKILIIVAVGSPSHFNVFKPMIKELAKRNHDVTIQSFYQLDQPLPNVKEIKITPPKNEWKDDVMKEFLRSTSKEGAIQQMWKYAAFMKTNCIAHLTDPTTKELVASGIQYDAVIINALFSECSAAVASLVGKHTIEQYPCASAMYKATTVPAPPSYVPNIMTLMPTKMNFFQRLENTINTIGIRFVNEYGIKATHQEVISEFLPQAEPVDVVEKKIAFTFTNGDPVVNSPRPTMPNVVNCGGMHCRDPKPLPKDLNDFVESSGDDGFIIFGLGSNMKSAYLEPEELDAIVSTFARLKQKVVWKFEGKLDNLPKNVKLVKWMPQQDLLGHPKARLFVTHSGLLSLQETIYHGIPVIGIPFFFDQRGNIMRMKELGIGEYLDFFTLTGEGFYSLVTKVLNDKSYYENMKKHSAIFKDQPETPLERAIFWVEYVIRHDGARHFRSAGEDLNFFQYFLIDVIGFVLLVAATGLGVVVYVIKFALRKICAKKNLKKISEKKTN